MLDEVATGALAPDPRIWPLKISRVGAAFGSAYTGLCVGVFPMERARLGPTAGRAVADFFVDLRRRLDPEPWGRDALSRIITQQLQQGGRVPGYGVSHRRADERLEMLSRTVRKYERADMPYWRLFRACSEVLKQARGLPPNLASGWAAMLLDLGYAPEQIEIIPLVFLFPNFLANAVEGAKQAPSALRKMPTACIEYVGPAPRRSPRSMAAVHAGSPPDGDVDGAQSPGGNRSGVT
jgi:hypothetical protein